MNDVVKVACVQAEPVVLRRDATIDKLARLTAEAAAGGKPVGQTRIERDQKIIAPIIPGAVSSVCMAVIKTIPLIAYPTAARE